MTLPFQPASQRLTLRLRARVQRQRVFLRWYWRVIHRDVFAALCGVLLLLLCIGQDGGLIRSFVNTRCFFCGLLCFRALPFWLVAWLCRRAMLGRKSKKQQKANQETSRDRMLKHAQFQYYEVTSLQDNRTVIEYSRSYLKSTHIDEARVF